MPLHKNIVQGTIHAKDNVHIGDIIYNIDRDFKSGSILFLRLDKKGDTQYSAKLSVKSKHSSQGKLASSGESWCEDFELSIPAALFDTIQEYQNFRRGLDTPIRLGGLLKQNPLTQVFPFNVQALPLVHDPSTCTHFPHVSGTSMHNSQKITYSSPS